MSCAAQKSLAAGHIMSFQIHPSEIKNLAEFAPAGAKKVRIIFGGGVYVAENTLRHASCVSLQEHKLCAVRLAKANPCRTKFCSGICAL